MSDPKENKVVDLMEALKASLKKGKEVAKPGAPTGGANDMSESLQTCPFCGGEVSLNERQRVASQVIYAVECDECGAVGPTIASAEIASAAWNCRPQVAAVRAQALREGFDDLVAYSKQVAEPLQQVVEDCAERIALLAQPPAEAPPEEPTP